MTNRKTAVSAPVAILALLALMLGVQKHAPAQSTAAVPVLKIGGKVATPLELSAADLKKMPRKTVTVSNPHDKKTEVYEGVLLQELFHRADFVDSEVIVADTMDGAPLGANQGPFKLVAPHDKRAARWVRMLKSLTVVQIEK